MTDRFYWDSSCFLTLLNEEEDCLANCRAVIDDAKVGDIELVTSGVAMAETVRPKGASSPLMEEERHRVLRLFENDWLFVQAIDISTARQSLSFCWDEQLHPRDSLHLAAAVEADCNIFETKDDDFINLNDSFDGLEIRRPSRPYEQKMFDE